MGRQRGGKRAVSGRNVSAGNEPNYPEFIRKCFEEDLQDNDHKELRFFEELIIEKYCEKLRKSFPNKNLDELKDIAVQAGSPWFELLKKDLEGVCKIILKLVSGFCYNSFVYMMLVLLGANVV